MSELPRKDPEIGSPDDASIREIMTADGTSYDTARQKWENMKAEVNRIKIKKQEGKENDG